MKETDSDDDEIINEELQFVKNYEKPHSDQLDEEILLNLQTVHEGRRQELNDIYDEARCVSTYSLSMESQIGEYYRLDKSLFGRFVDGNNAITIERTRLLIQRYIAAVLTPYSGQLIKIKDALSKSFSVEIDERDAENIADMEGEENNTSKPLNQRVTLRTVDNFQGEKAKIVIISLVRNCSGNKFSSIRFLKSKKMGRPSRLSSDGDLLNVCNPAFWQVSHTISFDPSLWIGIEHFVTPPPDAKLRGCGKIDVEKVESKIPQILLQIYKPHAWRANFDDGYVDNCEQKKAMICDDDSEDNSMVKSYHKNLDCIFQGKFYAFLPT
ncbi:unnamed protein product [Rhizophagus irregularis]|nr:unnamed protein product [Rhizophagus irregularis]